MDLYQIIDINIVSVVILGLVILFGNKRLDRNDRMNKGFLNTSVIVLIEIVFETFTCIINGRPELWLIPITNFLHVCLFVTGPILTYLGFNLIFMCISPDEAISKKKNFILIIPVVINFIITVFTPINGLFFSISSSNIYHRGPLFYFSAALTYIYILISFLLILIKMKKIVKGELFPLLIFTILPVIGGLLQSIFYGILLMWSSAAFSYVIVFIFLQQRMIQIDNMSGAWTRGSFDLFMSQRINQKNKSKFGVIFIDLDDLKKINDVYGHIEGDYSIKTAVNLIKSSLKRSDIIARYGGDEFVIVVDSELKEDLEKIVEKIDLNFSQFNHTSIKEYKLEYSYGIDIFNPEINNVNQFLNHVDNLMYSNKESKKS